MNILVTGATGFIGRAVVSHLSTRDDFSIRIAIRCQAHNLPSDRQSVQVGDLRADTNWKVALKDVQVVIHTAARVHVMNDSASDPLTEFRKVNLDGALNLARQAAQMGVKRFIFISSIKVNGEHTSPGSSFSSEDKFVPDDPYGLSKYEAEQGLLALAKETNMELVIIRPPLVYGPGVKANFATMIKWACKGFPLPLGAIHNKRSLVALDNLVDFMICCIDHPKAANEVFLISDGEDLSTTELLQKVARALGKKLYLIPLPVWLMRFVADLLGKGDVANRLFDSLQIDNSKARHLLGWKPVITVDEQLQKMAGTHLNEKTV